MYKYIQNEKGLEIKAVCVYRRSIKMGLLASSSSSSLVAITVFSLVLNAAVLCYGGKTSTYVRSDTGLNTDMPVNSSTFYVPPGENSPQQVFFSLYISPACHFYLLLFFL